MQGGHQGGIRGGISLSGRWRPALKCAGNILALVALVIMGLTSAERTLQQRPAWSLQPLPPCIASWHLARRAAGTSGRAGAHPSAWPAPMFFPPHHQHSKARKALALHRGAQMQCSWRLLVRRRSVRMLQVRRRALPGDAARHHDNACGPECDPVRHGARPVCLCRGSGPL